MWVQRKDYSLRFFPLPLSRSERKDIPFINAVIGVCVIHNLLQLTGRYSLRVILLIVFIKLNAAEFIKFFVIRVWHWSILTFNSKKLLSMKASFQCLVKLNYRIVFSCFRLYQALSFEYTELKILLQSRKIFFGGLIKLDYYITWFLSLLLE